MAKVITDIETYNLSKTGEQIDSLLDEIGSKVTQTEINTAINNLRMAIDKELTALKNGAPEAMDSLGEIANALQNNPKVIEEVRSAITKESEDRASALTAERSAWQQAVTSEQNARNEAVQQEREGREAADRDINADIENLKKADAAINDKITDLVSGGVPDESIGAEKIEGVEFIEATKRENIATGETLKTLFGKIKKWFSDLKPVAWSGSYNDLTDTDSIALSGTPTASTAFYGTNSKQIATTEFVQEAVSDAAYSLLELGGVQVLKSTLRLMNKNRTPWENSGKVVICDNYFFTPKVDETNKKAVYRVKIDNLESICQEYTKIAAYVSIHNMQINGKDLSNGRIGQSGGTDFDIEELIPELQDLNSGKKYLVYDDYNGGQYVTTELNINNILQSL